MSRLLVVDDDPHVRELTERVLSDKGFEVTAADDGVQALERIEADAPDIVLLDLEMPRLDGWGLLAKLAGKPQAPAVVFLSGQLDFDAFSRGARAGVAGFVAKPIHYTKLVTTCRRILHARSQPPQAADERRTQTRMQLLASVSLLSKEGHPTVPGHLADLSPGGAQILLVGPLEVGSRVRVGLDRSIAGILRFQADVRWCAPIQDGFAHGLAFRELTPELITRIREIVGESK